MIYVYIYIWVTYTTMIQIIHLNCWIAGQIFDASKNWVTNSFKTEILWKKMNLEKRIYVQHIDLYMISTLLANFTGVGHLSNCRVPFADNSSVQCSFSPPFDCISASWERNCLTWTRGWEAIRFGNSHLKGLKPTQSAGPSSFVGKHCPSALFSPDSSSYP